MDGNRNARTLLTGLTDQTLRSMQKGDIPMKWNPTKTMAVVLSALLVLIFSGQALAAGTAANTLVSNTANVEFTLGGVSSGPIPSTPAEFRVDERIDVIVANQDGGNIQVVAGSNDQALVFTVTNNSNTESGAATWFQLTTVADGTDNFDMSTVEIWEDVDGDGVVSAGDVNLTTAIGLGQTEVYVSLDVDEVMDILIVSDTPNTATTRTINQTAKYWLVAEAWDSDQDADGNLTNDVDDGDATNQPLAVDTVFDDGTGTVSGDGDGDGVHSDDGTYITITPVSIAKIVGDGNTSGYHIPGDTVTYTVTVTNSAASAATAVLISDVLPTETTYVDGSLSCAASAGGTAGTPDWSNDGTNFGDTESTSALAVSCKDGTIAAGGTGTMTFDVEIK